MITLLLLSICLKDKSRAIWGWDRDICISTCTILITIGLIWLWLIDLAHSSILLTFLPDPELSWIDWDLSSVAASLTESPVPTFYPREAALRCVQVPGYRAMTWLLWPLSSGGDNGPDRGWSGMTLGWWGVRSLNMTNIWETMSGVWEHSEARSEHR